MPPRFSARLLAATSSALPSTSCALGRFHGRVFRSRRFLRFLFRAAVSHIEDYFPSAIFLLLPDGVVFAVRDDRLAIFACRPELTTFAQAQPSFLA
jgi:hypothetical protein